MNRANLVGLLFTFASLAGAIFLLAADSHFTVIQWPYEAFQGLVFSIVWGFGVSATIGYVYAILITLTIAIVSYAIGHKVGRLGSQS